MADSGKHLIGRPFRKGEGGRKPGARNKLKEAFLEAVCADFERHGIRAVERLREEDPGAYLRVIAGLIPREIETEQGDGPMVPPVLVIKAWKPGGTE